MNLKNRLLSIDKTIHVYLSKLKKQVKGCSLSPPPHIYIYIYNYIYIYTCKSKISNHITYVFSFKYILDPSDFEYIASDRWPDRIQSWPSHGDNASLLAFRTAPEVRRDERIDGDRYVVGRWINSHGKSPFLIGKPRFLPSRNGSHNQRVYWDMDQ